MLSKRSVVSNLKQNIDDFLRAAMQEFIDMDESVQYSHIIYSIDLESCTFSFSVNTHFDANKAELMYQGQVEDFDLPRFSRYQDYAMCHFIEEQHLKAYYAEETNELLMLIQTQIKSFMSSRIYGKLPKTQDFKAQVQIVEPFLKVDLLS